jgi:1-acyl-sn-glycerol-3-phosphate acyltransferase
LTLLSRVDRSVANIQRRYLPVSQRKQRMHAFFSWGRAKLWGLVLSLFTSGLTTFQGADDDPRPIASKVTLPDGPLIVVANHTSHVDSVALVTMLGRTRPVVLAAAADYWLQDSASEYLSRAGIGIWPVRRDEGGWRDLEAAGELVKAGTVLVVFAEGSRSRDGEVQEFHTGAFRLAAEIGAQVLPIAIAGTHAMMPVGETRPKRRPINLRLGRPRLVSEREIDAATSQTRDEIARLLEPPTVNLPGREWQRIRKGAFSLTGLLICFFWAVGEGLSWPLVAEMPLMLFVVTVGLRWRGLAIISTSAIGSVVGIITNWWLVQHGIEVPSPMTTPLMFEVAHGQLATHPDTAFWAQMWNGIPVKVYAAEAGHAAMPFDHLLLALVPRVLRIFILGTGTWLLGGLLSRWLKPCLGFVQGTSLAIFPIGLWQAFQYWQA